MSRQSLSPGRLEAFSDGVIAVIITIMVLELKVPAQDGFIGLRVVLPEVFLYLLTFTQVGIYWVNHHYMIDEIESVSHGILWANLVFLFSLSMFPFATDWIGSKGLSHFSAAFYAAISLLPAVSYTVLWLQVRAQSVAPPHARWGKLAVSLCLYLAAIPVAFYGPLLSLGLVALVAVIWLLPPKPEATAEDDCRESAAQGEPSQDQSAN